jgi:Protein of unknown function (DUF4236)
MPWYLRKSFGRGPFRINLSKRGIGMSVGVKGLRVGTGPRGPYIAGGRGGLYFRQYFNAPTQHRQVSAPQRRPEYETPTAFPGGTVVVERTGEPVPGDEMTAEIARRLFAPRYGGWLIGVAAIAFVWLWGSGQMWAAIILCLPAIVAGCVLAKREGDARRIEFIYDDSDALVQRHRALVDAFRSASQCAAIWRVTTATASRDAKYTAGAGVLISRTLTRISFNDSRVHSNVTLAWLPLGDGTLCFLPERLLFFGRRRVMALAYGAVSIASAKTQFREDGLVPVDGRRIGSTWQYVNKNGSPDRRFSNNRQLPVLLYSDLLLNHPSIAFNLQFSRPEVASELERAINELVAVAAASGETRLLP